MPYSIPLHRLLALTVPLIAMSACATPIRRGDDSDDATDDTAAESSTTEDVTAATATPVTTTSTTSAEASSTSRESTSSGSTSSESSGSTGEQTDESDSTDASSTAAASTGEDPIGNCCEHLGGAGCDADLVEECVCAVDPYCCTVQWDAHCAMQVEPLGCGACPPM